METKRVLLIAGGALAAILLQTASARLQAQAQTASALSGQVTSAEGGRLDNQHQRCYQRRGPLCFPGRETRTRTLRIESARGRL
jgi:hypothetical protein